MSVAADTPYDKEALIMISLANIILQDMRRQARVERIARHSPRAKKVVHLGRYRVTVDRDQRHAA
jgi:hypothetical protein